MLAQLTQLSNMVAVAKPTRRRSTARARWLRATTLNSCKSLLWVHIWSCADSNGIGNVAQEFGAFLQKCNAPCISTCTCHSSHVFSLDTAQIKQCNMVRLWRRFQLKENPHGSGAQGSRLATLWWGLKGGQKPIHQLLNVQPGL